MSDYKIKYSVWCNTCNETRYTGYLDYTDPIPTVCPKNPAHTSIRDVAVADILNKEQYNVEDGGSATTQETTPQIATSLTINVKAKTRYRLHWYCEFKVASGATASVKVAYQGNIVSGNSGDHNNATATYIPFCGHDEFRASDDDTVTLAIQFWTSDPTKIATIRRRRLFVETVEVGE